MENLTPYKSRDIPEILGEQDFLKRYIPLEKDPIYECDSCNSCGSGDCGSCCSSPDD